MLADVRAIRRAANLPIPSPPVTAVQAAPIVQGASAQAETSAAIEAAVSGDLIATSPTLSAKIQDLQDQIDALTPP
jgi:hypothetical protein